MWAPRTFGHVAIAISDTLALEAVSFDPNDLQKKTVKLPSFTAKIGEWSGSELGAGVRLKPLGQSSNMIDCQQLVRCIAYDYRRPLPA